MLCCSAIVFLLGQCGAFGAAIKAHLFGGSGTVQSALAAAVAAWGKARWLALSGALAAEFVIAAAAMPALYALDMPSQLGNWPVCAAVLKALAR